MCEFIKVENLDKIRFSNRWKNSSTFYSQGRLINKKGEYVKVTYPGTKYQVAIKKERAFTAFERIYRFSQFIFFSLLSLGLCNINKNFRGLLTKDKLVCRYAIRFIDKKNPSNNEIKIDVNIDEKTKKRTNDTQMEDSYLQVNNEDGEIS